MGNQHVFLLHSSPMTSSIFTTGTTISSSSSSGSNKRWGQSSSLLILIFIIYTPLVINSIHAAQLETDDRHQQQQQQQSSLSSTASTSQPTSMTTTGPCESTVLERIPADPVSEITFCMILPATDTRYDSQLQFVYYSERYTAHLSMPICLGFVQLLFLFFSFPVGFFKFYFISVE